MSEEQIRAEFERLAIKAGFTKASNSSWYAQRGNLEAFYDMVWQAAISAKSVPENMLDSLDFERLRSGQHRALNPDNQPIFDKYFAAPPLPTDDERVRELVECIKSLIPRCPKCENENFAKWKWGDEDGEEYMCDEHKHDNFYAYGPELDLDIEKAIQLVASMSSGEQG